MISLMKMLVSSNRAGMRAWFCLVMAILVVACDQSKSLGNGYFISDDYGVLVDIWKKDKGQLFSVVAPQVVDWRRSGSLVFVLRMKSISPDCYDANGISTIDTYFSDEKEYWVIDTDRKIEYGPLNLSAFETLKARLGFAKIKLTVPDTYHSNKEYFEKAMKTCSRTVGNVLK